VSRGVIGLAAAALLLSSATTVLAADEQGPAPQLTAELEPAEGTVGDPLALRLTLELPADAELLSPLVGPELGPFAVLSGAWADPQPGATGSRRTWSGRVAAYRTGELELPAVKLQLRIGAESVTIGSQPIPVRVESVLGDDESSEPAGIKDPVALPADFRALRIALGVLLGLLVATLGVWWAIRRYGGRLAARSVPADPFDRIPPHEWVYAALRELLDRRLAEQGNVIEFHAELARIIKRYLGGRYRVDLMERTTTEVPEALRQAGTPEPPLRDALALLERSDRVKFARQLPDPSQCRQEIDEAYAIVDRTRPSEAADATPRAETA